MEYSSKPTNYINAIENCKNLILSQKSSKQQTQRTILEQYQLISADSSKTLQMYSPAPTLYNLRYERHNIYCYPSWTLAGF